ncbi:MAG: hypothetical protein IS860_11525 [Nitrosopumilus sp.]|nr:hypothetical protein [Nitrosopumilus sp.]
MDNVGCVTLLKTYYAYNTYDSIQEFNTFTEYLVPNGRVDPGDDITVKLQVNPLSSSQVQAFVSTPDLTNTFASAQITLGPGNTYSGSFGIEGTVSAPDEYSSIPMSKFTNMKVKQTSGTWVDLPSTATMYTPDTSDGYLGDDQCSNTTFIAGSVMSLDCNNVAVSNQIPIVQNFVYNPTTNAQITININATDTDYDYLQFFVSDLPSSGTLSHTNMAERIPNVSGNSTTIDYTPDSTTPDSDTFRYTVSDSRTGHSREGLVSIVGPQQNTVPDAIDDFDHTLNGNVIMFSWGAPANGGANITSYRIERSTDTSIWNFHDTVSETTFNLNYTRYPGYDGFFRIFANNALGMSAASDVEQVHVPDTTPPTVTISVPSDNTTIAIPEVSLSGFAVENDGNYNIDSVDAFVNGVAITYPLIVTHSITTATFASTLDGMANGVHTISVNATNNDGAEGTASVDITLDVRPSVVLGSFTEDFEGTDLADDWWLYTEDDKFWSIRDIPSATVPDSQTGNKVGGSEDCDDICTMIMIDKVDLTQISDPVFSFYRYVASGADISNSEGLYVYTSIDDGAIGVS